MRIGPFRALAVVMLLVGTVSFLQTTAQAQSPTPKWYMFDTAPKGPFPPKARDWTKTANAVVVFGWGSLNCNGTPYTVTNIKNSTTYWMNHGYQVVTELDPDSSCGTVSAYETEIHTIEKDVETTHKATDPGRYWGGFLLDEERSEGFTPTQLVSLNSYVRTLMAHTTGLSWYFSADTMDGWAGSISGNAATYHKIATGSWLAPQVYNGTDAKVVNYACSNYSMCTNDVTINEVTTGAWGNYVTVTGAVTGTPWSNSTWGATYWCNEWVFAT